MDAPPISCPSMPVQPCEALPRPAPAGGATRVPVSVGHTLRGSPACHGGRCKQASGFAEVRMRIDTCADHGVWWLGGLPVSFTVTGRVAYASLGVAASLLGGGGATSSGSEARGPGQERLPCHAGAAWAGGLLVPRPGSFSVQVTGCGDLRLRKLLWLSSLHSFLP